jgi:hypothetical protein
MALRKKPTKDEIAHEVAVATMPQSRQSRETSLTVRLNPTEYAMLTEISLAEGISLSDVVRMSIRGHYAERKDRINRNRK